MVLMLFLGLIYAWSLFVAPLEQQYGWTRSQTSMTFSICMVFFVLGSMLASRLQKRLPFRSMLWISALLFLVGFLETAGSKSLLSLYFFYGVLIGAGVGISYNALLAGIPRWFPDRPGFCTGLLLMGMGLGCFLMGGVIRSLMNLTGWTASFRLLAVAFALVFGIGGILIKVPASREQIRAAGSSGLRTKEMLFTSRFWMIYLWAVLTSAVGLGIVSNASQMATARGLSESLLSLAVGLVSVGNGMGRFLYGSLLDRIGGKRAMMIAGVGFSVAFAVLAASRSLLILMMCLLIIGISYGAPPTLSAAQTKTEFGAAYYAENLSVIITVLLPAAIIGPMVSSRVLEKTGSFGGAYLIMLILSLISFVPLWLYRPNYKKGAHRL